jgi:uncharacterized coiled-coil protein SlyX
LHSGQQVLDQAPFLIGAGFFERVTDQTREIGQLNSIVDALAANCAANRACVDKLTTGMGKMAVDVADNKSEIARVEQKTKMGIADNKSEIAQLQTQMKHLQQLQAVPRRRSRIHSSFIPFALNLSTVNIVKHGQCHVNCNFSIRPPAVPFVVLMFLTSRMIKSLSDFPGPWRLSYGAGQAQRIIL